MSRCRGSSLTAEGSWVGFCGRVDRLYTVHLGNPMLPLCELAQLEDVLAGRKTSLGMGFSQLISKQWNFSRVVFNFATRRNGILTKKINKSAASPTVRARKRRVTLYQNQDTRIEAISFKCQ